MAAPKGSRNAAKAEGEHLSAVLLVRCHPDEKSAYVNAACGKKLAAWVRATLNARVGRRS